MLARAEAKGRALEAELARKHDPPKATSTSSWRQGKEPPKEPEKKDTWRLSEHLNLYIHIY